MSVPQKLLDKETDRIVNIALEETSGFYKHNMLDLDNLCAHLNVKIYEANLEDENVSGVISKDGSSWTIIVNELHSSVRKRFTVAHELGHYFAIINNSLPAVEYLEDNDNMIKDYFILNREENVIDDIYQVERQANMIGASILMPEPMVRSLLEEKNSVIDMAQKFGVSEAAMTFRLKSLNLCTTEMLE